MAVLWQLFISFFSIGLFSFGGGYAMIPMIRDQLVSKGYMTLQQIVDMVAISQMTPGPFAVNAATFAGMRVVGVAGAASATLGVVLPSLCLSALVSRYFFRFREQPLMRDVLQGIRPVIAGLILAATLSIAFQAFVSAAGPLNVALLGRRIDLCGVGIAIFAFVMIQKTKLSPIWVTLICAAAGILIYGL